jgi:adenylate cyclase
VQTVKYGASSSGGLSRRAEWEQPYEGAFDFSQIDNAHVADLLERHKGRLAPVFTTRFRRETLRYSPREGVKILLMIDEGTIQSGGRSAPIRELELELEEGEAVDLLELARELASELPLVPNDLSKAERGYRLYLDETVQAVRAEESAIKSDQSVIDAFHSLADGCIRQWQGNSVAAADDRPTPENIHQIRVALRRLRSLMKLFAPALSEQFVTDWNARLRENASRFGAARDLDVFHEELFEPVSPEGLLHAESCSLLQATAADARQAAREMAERNLDAAAQGQLILEFSAALHRVPPEVDAAVDLRTFAKLRLARLRRRGRRRFEAAADLAPSRLHELRIAMKELRYATEFLAPLFPDKKVQRYHAHLARAQRVLGFLQDVVVARRRLDTWVRDDARLTAAAAFLLGWHAPRYANLRRRVLHDCEPVLCGNKPW